jgi:endoglucanase
MPGHISARLGKRLSNAKREFALESEAAPSAEPEFAVWNLPDFELRKGHIRGRACDDLIGVAVALAVLAHQQRQDAALHLIAAITRAEEVGFHGALALATGNLLPRNSLIISLETSRELPPAKMGEGVIIRTGDRASVFSSAGSRFLAEIAAGMNRSEGDFKYQRALMSGGTCEATAYQENGFECAAVCVALGNYHNCGAGNKIAAEFVSAADVSNMARLLSQAAVEMARWKEIVGRLPKRLADYQREAVRALKKQRLVL